MRCYHFEQNEDQKGILCLSNAVKIVFNLQTIILKQYSRNLTMCGH